MSGRLAVAILILIPILLGLAILSGGPASAHAFLRVADPAEDSTVTTAPGEIRLAFTEPVEVRFSIFKVYRLDANHWVLVCSSLE